MTGARAVRNVLAGVLLAGGMLAGLCLGADAPKAAPASRPANASQGGKVVGILTHFEYNWAKTDTVVMVKAEGAKEEMRYLLAPKGEAVAPQLQAAVKQVFSANAVELTWQMQQDQPVVTGIRVLTPRDARGMASGIVAACQAGPQGTYVDLKADGSPLTERYVPFVNMAERGFDKAISAAIGQLNVGDKVRITWMRDERRRAVKIEVLSRAPAAPAAQKPMVPGGPVGDLAEVQRDIEYGKGGTLSLKLDLFRPKERGKGLMPAIVWFHGGGWSEGNKVMIGPAKPDVLLRNGYCLISADYRLSGQARFPAAVEDCKCAVRWVRKHAREYGIDPDRIAAMGYSAGGHLALMVGCAQDQAELEGKAGNEGVSSRVQAVCSLSGPTDLTAFRAGSLGEKAVSDLCGGTPAEKPEVYKQASPISYAAKANPPVLMIHGDLDGTVPVAQADSMAETLKRAGAKVTYIRVRNYTHTKAEGKQEPSAEEVQKAILDFLELTLKAPAKDK